MRTYLIPAALIALAGASSAFAATTTAGAIKSIDAKAMSITLQDGTSYVLPKGFKVDGLKVGEKVSVIWDAKGGKNEATEVKTAG